jgi:hypothetical protein
MLKYRTTNRNAINLLFRELEDIRAEIDKTFSTPAKNLPGLNKAFVLDGLDHHETFLITKLAEEKKILSAGLN